MNPDLYHGREQTYSKHLFLQRYLETVAFHIAYTQTDFVYVDGFSGPWKAADEGLQDTSFMIAIRRLEYVRDGINKAGRTARIRCSFIEANRTRFEALERATNSVSGIQTSALFGEFESVVPAILGFLDNSFSLVFLDPTGWQGFAMERIKPLLQRRKGEVIVNFMYDHINRFLGAEKPETEATFDSLFGSRDWRFIRESPDREKIVDFYAEQLRLAGGFSFATHTPILKPLADRPHFFLIYCTRNIRGLIEFRATEKKSVGDQERIREGAKLAARVDRTRQAELYDASELDPSAVFIRRRGRQLAEAKRRFSAIMSPGHRVGYEQLLGRLLVLPFVWESDVKQMVAQAIKDGVLLIEDADARQRVPKLNSTLKCL